MTLAAVLWDVDDTLFDNRGAERAGILAQLEDEGLLGEFDSPEEALGLWHSVTEAAYERFLAGELGFTEQRIVRVNIYLGEIGRSTEDPAAWFEGYRRHFESSWRLFPDVVPVLDRLADGYRHAVLSNSSAVYQHGKLLRLGVRDRFDPLLCSEELGAAKPDPAAFLAACDALGLRPHEVAYVGDKRDVDAEGATAAGLHGIWLDRLGGVPAEGGAEGGDALRIRSLEALPDLLERLPGGAPAIDFGATPPIG